VLSTKVESTSFCVLGIGGELTVYFPEGFADGPGADVVVVEESFDRPRAAEYALAFASMDGVDWRLLGKAGNSPVSPGASPDTASGFDLAPGGLKRAAYIKLVDVTRPRNQFADGFDVSSVRVIHRTK
jgi:hypothetical protein